MMRAARMARAAPWAAAGPAWAPPALPVSMALLAVMGTVLAACSGGEHDAGDLYRTHCVRCHSADGKGDRRSVGLYPNLDLTASPLVLAGARARGLLYQRISEGTGAMPGFGHRLETADLEQLVDYVLRLPRGKADR
jgi:mono/diheme cytochrome c family protein